MLRGAYFDFARATVLALFACRIALVWCGATFDMACPTLFALCACPLTHAVAWRGANFDIALATLSARCVGQIALVVAVLILADALLSMAILHEFHGAVLESYSPQCMTISTTVVQRCLSEDVLKNKEKSC